MASQSAERTKMGPGSAGRGGSSLEDMDDDRVSGDRETASGGPGAVARKPKGAAVIKCFECQQRTAQAWCDNCYQVSTCFQWLIFKIVHILLMLDSV
jgi:hypothetical protein